MTTDSGYPFLDTSRSGTQNPGTMPQSRDPEDLIRELLVRELETVNVYTEMIARAQTTVVRELLTEITRQEKHHIAEAMDMLSRVDAGQAAALERAGLGRPQSGKLAAATVDFEPAGISVELAVDATLLETAKAAGIDIRNDCGGHGVCGTCRLEVLEGADGLSEITDPERKHLAGLLEEGWRLACQTTSSAAVRVRVPTSKRSAGSEAS